MNKKFNKGDNKMKVFRVENEYGYGCYCSHMVELEDMYIDHSRDRINRPITKEDIGRNWELGERHAFIDKKQALDWFSIEDLKLLDRYGFNLIELEVKEITAIGKKQILVKI